MHLLNTPTPIPIPKQVHQQKRQLISPMKTVMGNKVGKNSIRHFAMILALSPLIIATSARGKNETLNQHHRMLPAGIQNICGASYMDSLNCGAACPGVSYMVKMNRDLKTKKLALLI